MGNSVSAAESVAAHVTGNVPKGHPAVHNASEPPPECPMHKKADAAPPKSQVFKFCLYNHEIIFSLHFFCFSPF